MQRETYNFSEDFSNSVLACLLRHPEIYIEKGYASIIQPSYFNSMDQIETTIGIDDYYQKYGHFPKFETLAQFLFDRFRKKNPDRASALFDYVGMLAEFDTRDVDYVVDQTVVFAKERAIYAALKEVVAAQQDGKEVNVINLFEQALSVGVSKDAFGLLHHEDANAVIDHLTSVNFGVMTGFDLLDDVWQNGWGAGWLIAVLAPPKRFKTATCLNLALNMIKPGIEADVIYFAAEIDEYLAMGRNLCATTGLTFEDMRKDKENFKEQAAINLKAKAGGNLIYRGFPSKSATVQDMELSARAIVSHLGLKNLRAIIIDQAETTKPSVSKDTPQHRQQSDIYTDARAMGRRLKCAVIVADRCNKETVDKATPSMTSFQGAFEKAGIVDIGIGLCATEKEHKDNDLRMFVFLNRHGAEGHHFRCKVRPEVMQIEMVERIPWEPSDEADKPKSGGKKKGFVSNPKTNRNPVNEAISEMRSTDDDPHKATA